MKKIGLISDTHGYMGEDITKHLKECDEIWHAGDLGTVEVLEELEQLDKKLRVVYGNIDNRVIRAMTEEVEEFEVEGIKVFMIHIGGYPGRYARGVKTMLKESKPLLYVCGHSHILKIVPDGDLELIHMNPGACGHKGRHSLRTFILFDIDDGKIENVRVVELGRRGRKYSEEE